MRNFTTLEQETVVTTKTRNLLIVILIMAVPLAVFIGAVIYKGLIER